MADEFGYKLIEKNPVTIVTFQGRMNKDAKESLLKCHQDMNEVQSGNVIFFFKDVQAVDHIIFRELTMVQAELRKKGKNIFVVGLSTSLKQFLTEKGIVRLAEVKSSLDEAIRSLNEVK